MATEFKNLTLDELNALSPAERIAYLEMCNKKSDELLQDFIDLNNELDNEE